MNNTIRKGFFIMADKVYVYGTLMKDYGNHGYYLSQFEFFVFVNSVFIVLFFIRPTMRGLVQ